MLQFPNVCHCNKKGRESSILRNSRGPQREVAQLQFQIQLIANWRTFEYYLSMCGGSEKKNSEEKFMNLRNISEIFAK